MADSTPRGARLVTLARDHPWSPFRRAAAVTTPHDPRTATVLGRVLGLCLAICLLTGLYSHLLQEPPAWMVFPTSPAWLYRLSQGAHVACGIAAIPLTLAKLWTVYPRLFQWPPLRGPVHAARRGATGLLVATVVTQLFMGFANTLKWYPWPFSFRTVHFQLSWVLAGAVLIHIALWLPVIARHWRRGTDPVDLEPDTGWSRRGLLSTTAVAVAAVTVTTVGQTVAPLGPVAVLAPRRPGDGPQGLAVNRTAAQAGITHADTVGWRVTIRGARTVTLRLSQLESLPRHRARLPIACVEGWSRSADWEGVRLADLLDLAEIPPSARIHVVSAQRRGGYGSSILPAEFARDPRTLLALRLNGETLHLDHGYPARLIAPARPGATQTKWVRLLEVAS